MKKFTLNNCVLRSFAKGDEVSFSEQADNIKIWRNVRDEFPSPYTLDAAKNWVSLCENEFPLERFAIEVDEKAVGAVGLHKMAGANYAHQMEIGFWLGEAYWGRGIISEVVPTVVNHAFLELGIQRIEASVYEYNPASKRVLEKSGFQYEGCSKGGVVKEGKLVDVWRFGILKT